MTEAYRGESTQDPQDPQYVAWRRSIADQVSAWINNIPFKWVMGVGYVQIHQPQPQAEVQLSAEAQERINRGVPITVGAVDAASGRPKLSL